MNTPSLVRWNQVLQITGLSRATIDRLILSNDFPRPFPIAKQIVGWELADIKHWIAARKAAVH